MKREILLGGMVLAAGVLAACTQLPAAAPASGAATARPPAAAQAQAAPTAAKPPAAARRADYSAFPCLSYTLPCGKVATRRPVARTLDGALNGNADRGRQLAFARNQGNCLACHVMKGGPQPGTRGPDLSRYGNSGRSDAETYAAVYDMRSRIADTLMPPFGTNGILGDQEIRDVVAFLQA
ncbi:MAG TPA: sulfur oxidation c-type cytochrome SoxX, partial [Zeimonas sp.]|nr:sulfur oxidation c-type cytochrome SoxX [Zeimonas sp.]